MKITHLVTHLLTAHWVDDPSFPQMLHSTAVIRIETDSKIDGLGESTWGYFAPDAVRRWLSISSRCSSARTWPLMVGLVGENLRRLRAGLPLLNATSSQHGY